MLNKFKLQFSITAIIIFAVVYLSGCVNYDQKTVLKADGSGSMQIHYWAKLSSFSMGKTLGKFEFEEQKARDNYTSTNTDVTSLKVEDDFKDSLRHVWIDLTFKDLNKLPDAKGFKGVTPSWKETDDGMELKYIVMKDTSAAGNMGSSDYDITYEFDMPDEIVSTNGKKDGKKVTWNYKVSDLKNDLNLTAVVKKDKGKTCGIFGFISAMGLIGLAYYTQRNIKRLKK